MSAAAVCEQFDVFKIPHSRMMQLVNSCNRSMDVTDFTNNDDLFVLLSNLQNIFKEFKNHEEIENEFIMRRLNLKLKAMAIHNSAVCNCHKEDEFSPLFNLLESGYLFINKSKSISERINFGVRLRKALKQFTQRFVPHMKEEEEIFQPLLLEYFTPEELAEMKTVVIKLHLTKKKFSTVYSSSTERSDTASSSSSKSSSTKPDRRHRKLFSSTTDNQNECQQQNHIIETRSRAKNAVTISSMPDELLMRIFSHLPLSDKFRAASVCKRWNSIVYDALNWTQLSLDEWESATTATTDTTSKSTESNNLEQREYKNTDEDIFLYYANENDGEETLFKNQHDMTSTQRTLRFWIKHLLPRIGTHVTKLNLSNCKSLSNNLTRRIIQMCPNIKDLDLSFTNIGDNVFRGICLEKLENLNCEGCEQLSDNAFKFILISSASSMAMMKNHRKCTPPSSQNGVLMNSTSEQCNDCINNRSAIEDLYATVDVYQAAYSDVSSSSVSMSTSEDEESYDSSFARSSRQPSPPPPSNQLQSINLSGCWSITDYGLGYIASKFDLSKLEYLNLSGCVNVTSSGMSMLASAARDSLRGENLYYCDNITDGPLRQTANGCENVGCATKYCCRSTQQEHYY